MIMKKSLHLFLLSCALFSILCMDSTHAQEQDEPEYYLEPLEIHGTKERDVITEPLSESPGLRSSVSVVTQKEIERQGADTVIEALEYIPGAWVETRGRKVKQFFSVRGQKYPYPDYAIDGALYREFHEIPYFFATEDIERIEVMRSSAAMLTGISGLGGVINIVPREYTESETSWEVEYGSFNTRKFHLSHGGTIKDLSYAVGVGAPFTDGPDDRHAGESTMNFYGSTHWHPTDKLSIRTTLFHINGKRELAHAKPPASERFQTTDETFDPLDETFAQMKLFYLASKKASTEFHVSYSNRDNSFTSTTETSHTSSRDWDHEWSANLVQSLALTEHNTLRAGGFYNHWIAPDGKRFYVGRRTDLETFAAVIVDEHRIGKLFIDAGLRWQRTYINEYGAYNINGSSRGFNNVPSLKDKWEPSIFNGSIGASYELTPTLVLSVNAAAGQIKPRTGTLDVDLEEPGNERRFKFDAGVEKRIERIGNLAVTGFIVQQSDALVLSGETEEVGGRLNELWINRDQDQLGVEMEIRSVPLYRTAAVFFNVTAMRSRAKSGGDMKRNVEMPEIIAGGGISAVRRGFDLNIFVKAVSSYGSSRFSANAPETEPLGEYGTVNLTMGKTFDNRLRTRVYLEITNLTDKKFSTVVGYPDFGRRFSIGLRQAL